MPAPNSYPIDCTGNVVIGDMIEFTEGVFIGSYPRSTFAGHRTIRAEVIAESYGQAKQQHTFTLRVAESFGMDRLQVGTTIYRNGRTIYRNGTHRQAWIDEACRKGVVDEKHDRGGQARTKRAERLNYGF